MNYKLAIGALATSILIVGCGSTSHDNSNVERFTTKTINNDTLEQDNVKKLEWVGSKGADGNACQANPRAAEEIVAVESAKDHCMILSFAGYEDWRVPTPEEQSEMIIAMRAAGKTPFYTVPACPRLMGVNGTTAQAVNTHNTDPVGKLTPWSELLQLPKTNYGVKCVRSF